MELSRWIPSWDARAAAGLSTNIPILRRPTQLSNLSVLNVSLNGLEDIPAELGAISKLESLNMNDNRMKTVPDVVRFRLRGSLPTLRRAHARVRPAAHTLPMSAVPAAPARSCFLLAHRLPVFCGLGSLTPLARHSLTRVLAGVHVRAPEGPGYVEQRRGVTAGRHP